MPFIARRQDVMANQPFEWKELSPSLSSITLRTTKGFHLALLTPCEGERYAVHIWDFASGTWKNYDTYETLEQAKAVAEALVLLDGG